MQIERSHIQQPAPEQAFRDFFGFGPPASKAEKEGRKGAPATTVAAVPNLLSRVESSLMTDLLDVIAKVFQIHVPLTSAALLQKTETRLCGSLRSQPTAERDASLLDHHCGNAGPAWRVINAHEPGSICGLC